MEYCDIVNQERQAEERKRERKRRKKKQYKIKNKEKIKEKKEEAKIMRRAMEGLGAIHPTTFVLGLLRGFD